MFGQNHIQDFVAGLLPRQKQNPNGWFSFNCPACVRNGEPTPDTKQRMGAKFEDAGVHLHCFRCGYNTGWRPGQNLNDKLKKLLGWMGASQRDIQQANLECLRIRQDFVDSNQRFEKVSFKTEKVQLPQGALPLERWANLKNVPEKFISVLDYIHSRSPRLLDWYQDFHWTPEMPEHFIIPVRYDNEIVGWTARLAREPKDKYEIKYVLEKTDKFLFNTHLLDDPLTKYVILVEGPLDAIALNGLAVMGNQITERQMRWLNSSDKEIVVLADKDKGGQLLIDAALKNGWSVSFPELTDFKDGMDLANKYGRLFAVKTIIDSRHSNSLQINMLRKAWTTK